MWIGTENGLNRFDGHSFLIYKPGKPKQSISDIFINDIEQDSRGRLWVSTASGLNVIDTEKDSTQVFYAETKVSIPSNLIWDTYIDAQNRVWMAPDNRDLTYYDIGKKSFTKIQWIKFITEFFPGRQTKYNSIRKINYKSDDELWLGTVAGQFSYRISTGEFTWHKSIDTARKHIATTDCNNYRWLPAGKNIVEINTLTGDTLLISHKADDLYSLPDGKVRTIYRDNTGLVWVATSNGVGKFNPCMNLFPFTQVLPPSNENKTEENEIYRLNHPVHTVFYSKVDDKYYISSPASNCLFIKDRATGQTEKITNIHGIPLTRCSVIFEDSKGLLWILAGTSAFSYDRGTRRFTVSTFRCDKRITIFSDMAEDQDGNLWIAAFNDGLYCYNPVKNTNTKFDDQDGVDRLPSGLYFDRTKNKLIVGSFGYNAYIFDTRQMRFTRLSKHIKYVDFSKYSMITDVAVDKKGTLWMTGYATGVARVENYSDSLEIKLQLITTQEGLPENNVYALQPDHLGNIWTVSYQGISCLDNTGKVIANYNRKTSLNFTNFYSPLTRSDDGEIFTGIGDGFIRFRPDSLHYVSPDFRVVFTGIQTKDSTEKNIFSYSNNEIQFDFAALSFLKPAQTQYEYFLEEFDKDWVNAGNAASTHYNNLSPGSYTFKVRAYDFTGKRSSNVEGFSFTIKPPWWQTWWFRIAVVFIVVAATWLLFRQRIRTIQNKARVRQQMTELQSKALRAQMNPHFIFNCLNAIQELIVREKYDGAYNYLSKFSRLLRMVLDMSDKTLIPLSTEIEMCRLYLELESLRFQHSFEYSIHLDSGIDADTVMVPSLLLQPFIENAIWHGLLLQHGEKKLLIRFEEQPAQLICIVQDNGIGRKKSAEIKSQKIGSQHFHSKGIELTKQRIENLGATGSQQASLEIKDGIDENGEASGTVVRITISQHENSQS